MNKEDLQKDLENFKKQREEMVANINAISGVISYIEQLLNSEDKKEEQK